MITNVSKTTRILSLLIIIFLYIPIVVIIIYSFNKSKIGVNWTGFTLKWYYVLINDKNLIQSALASFIIASVSSVIAVIFGTCAGIAIHKYKIPFFSSLIYFPVVVPEIGIGLSLLLLFIMFHITLGYVSVVLAHIAFCISFVTLTVISRMDDYDDSLMSAARDLGANQIKAFFLILIPSLLPGIIAGGLMAFTLSIDDFIITFFTTGAGTTTLPLFIYSMIKVGVTPEINAISTIIIIFTLFMSLLISKLSPIVLEYD